MKSHLVKTAGALGGYQIARMLTNSQPRILMYHRFSREPADTSVSEATFDRQLRLIKRHFNPMTLTDLAICLRERKNVPRHMVVITVDDGYRDFYEIAYPLLKRHGVPATFFVTTGFVNQDLWLWPDQVTWLLNNKVGNAESLMVAGQRIDLNRPIGQAWAEIVGIFLSVTNDQRLQGLEDLQVACARQLPPVVPPEFAASSWKELAEMQNAGIEIGGHTVSHPSLGHMREQDAAWEIRQSWDMLSENLGERPRSFCFPNGQPDDYSEAIKAMVKEAGYTAAVTAFSDRFNIQIPYAWRRFTGCEESFQFRKSLFGVEHLGNSLRKTTRCAY